MKLTQEQQALLNGEKGAAMAKVMKTLVMYGEIFGAEKMVPVTSRYNHLVTSFGLKALGPVYDLMDQLIAAGAVSGQKFSADPRPLDPKVPANFLQNLVFKKFMYSKQGFYEGQLKSLGLKDDDAFSCACYLDEQGNRPEEDHLAAAPLGLNLLGVAAPGAAPSVIGVALAARSAHVPLVHHAAVSSAAAASVGEVDAGRTVGAGSVAPPSGGAAFHMGADHGIVHASGDATGLGGRRGLFAVQCHGRP